MLPQDIRIHVWDIPITPLQGLESEGASTLNAAQKVAGSERPKLHALTPSPSQTKGRPEGRPFMNFKFPLSAFYFLLFTKLMLSGG